MDDSDLREQILRLEVHIEELTEASERCQKIIVGSKFVVAFGGLVFVALTLQAIRFDPIAMIGAVTALVGGAVAFGSNASTLKQTTAAMKAAEALRTEIISKIDLRVVG
jgi:hypothetical protein